MANPLKGEASFDHEGRELTVRIDVDVLMQMEEATGIGLFDMERGLSNLRVLAVLLMLGLRSSGVVLDRTAAAELLMHNAGARAAVQVALNRALPADEGEAGGQDGDANPTKAARKAGAGKGS